jgi:hypothetical protein
VSAWDEARPHRLLGLVTSLLALICAAFDGVRAGRVGIDEALEALTTTVVDLFAR